MTSCLATALYACVSLAGPGYVVDGDTIRTDDGVYLRLAEIDTPERGWRAECDAERMLAIAATMRLEELLADGFSVEVVSTQGGYGRPLVHLLLPDGMTAAEAMLNGPYGVPWAGRMHDWCGAG